MAARGQVFDLGRCLFAQAHGYNFIAQPTRGLKRQQREPAVSRDHAVAAHLINPRSDEAMKARTSSTSGPISISAPIRSTACVVFSPDLVSRRNTLCRLSIAGLEKPRRSRPTLFSPNTLDSRGVTVSEYGSTSLVITL